MLRPRLFPHLWLCLAALSLFAGGGCVRGDRGNTPDVAPADPVAVGSSSPVLEGPEGAPLRVRYGADPAQIGWLQLPDLDQAAERPAAGWPVVVLIHGGFWAEPWDYTLMSDLAAGLNEQGLATWNIEFRRLRGRGEWPATFDDVRAAIDHLEVLGVDHPLRLDAVVTVGHSSGGHLALWVSRDDVVTTPEVVGAFGLAAITDLRLTAASIELLGGTPAEVPDRWAAAAPSLDPDTVVLIHGDQDTTVPIAAVANAVSARVPLQVVPGADHLSLITAGGAGFQQVVATVGEAVAAS